MDLEWNYYLSKENIGRNRAEAVISHLQELNSYVTVELCGKSLQDFKCVENIKEFDIVIVADFYPMETVF